MTTYTQPPSDETADTYPVTPGSYVLALLIGLRYDPDTCRRILETCPTVPASSGEMAELYYQKTLTASAAICRDQYSARVALADGYWVKDDHEYNGIHVISCLDKSYPRGLKDLPDYPLVIYVAGDPAILKSPKLIAIVGSREPSKYGERVSRRLGEYFAEKGWNTVSGLAVGCDTRAHEGCMQGGQPTVAVLPGGFGHLYPQENRGLARRIIETGGCWVSEYARGIPPTKAQFIARDRIQAALSKGVIVVESEVGGGTMHTARYALQLGRKLGCMGYDREVPDAKMGGNDELVKSGKAVRLVEAKDMEKFCETLVTYPRENNDVNIT